MSVFLGDALCRDRDHLERDVTPFPKYIVQGASFSATPRVVLVSNSSRADNRANLRLSKLYVDIMSV